MIRLARAVVLALIVPASLFAEPGMVHDRTLQKEPIYQTKNPKYGMIAFGPAPRDRVWLVMDGETLYVDRNGNGDLTEPDEKVEARKLSRPRLDSDAVSFDIGDLRVGGRTHKGFNLTGEYIASFGGASLGKTADAKAQLARDPKAIVFTIQGDVDVPGARGGGVDGRLNFMAGPMDLNGLLVLSNSPADAPVVNLGGPVQITFCLEKPLLRVGKSSEFVLVLGIPGEGKGTLAMLGYEGTVPKNAKPMAEVTYFPTRPDVPPLKEIFEIKERC